MSVLEQDHFKYDGEVVLDTVMQGNARLFEIMREKDEIYAKEDFTEEDGIKTAEHEAEFAQMNGWEAESDAANLLNGLGIETDLHRALMGDGGGGQHFGVVEEGVGETAHVPQLGEDLAAVGHAACLDDEPRCFRDRHEVALDIGMRHGDGASVGDLLLEQRNDRSAGPEHISEAHSRKHCL